MPNFPDPEYISETLTGVIFKEEERHLLAVGGLTLLGECVAQGALTLRYAVPTLNPPIRWVIPGLLVGERGGAFTGRKAWDYMQDRWEHHPRADVVGLDPTGAKQTYFLKELDLAAQVRAYAYGDASTFVPLCLLDGIAAPPGFELPELAASYLPVIGG